ncbi:hypothetical protein Rhopal_004754-T1 [Rhodotorula paludigena]|uniref:Proteophosphoglycan ppg4 n=1 Tax=Rhodotorula paludigena TaxID=86838 RepID=A0AAV5GGP1_9BASI|nr:hypothetical protein Rhopal_004754-T1 [Rhodotorula paludigena]
MPVHTHSGGVATDSSSDRPTGEASEAGHALASEGSSTGTFEATFEWSSASLQQSAPTQWRSDDAGTATPSASGLVTSSRTAHAGGPSSSPSFTLWSSATSIVAVERLTTYASSASVERSATKTTVESVSSEINASAASTHAVPALSVSSVTRSLDKGDAVSSPTAPPSSSTASFASHEAFSPSASLPGSTDSASSSSSSSALSPGDIGAIVGGIVAFVGLALLVFFVHRRRRRENKRNVYSGVDAAAVDDPFRPEMREALGGSAGYARSASYSSSTQDSAAWDAQSTLRDAPAASELGHSGADDDRRSLLRAAKGCIWGQSLSQ